ncbi:hypothetical protein ACFXTO_014954 [Malus domestica]
MNMFYKKNPSAPSHLKGYFQTCNDSRVLPPLGTPNDAMEKLPPKVDVLQITHPIHPPKEPDKGRRCQVKGWENKKQANGYVQDQLTMLNLDYSSMVEELMAVGSEKLKEAQASLGLQTGGTVQHAVEITLDSPMTLLTGTFAGGSVLSSHFFVATREILTWHHSVSFSVFHQWPAISSNSSRSFGSLGLSFDKKWLYYMLARMVVYLETHTALVLVASIMIFFLRTPRLGRTSSASLCKPT